MPSGCMETFSSCPAKKIWKNYSYYEFNYVKVLDMLLFLLVQQIWSDKAVDRVEAVVGPYKLYNSSLKTLQGSNWLSDEVGS